jgi:lysozyme
MEPRHHVSSAAVALIKRFEGYRRAAAKLPDGRWTIGYGHSRSAREGVRIDEDDASALLLYDLGEVAGALNELIFTPLSQNQFDALASFAMNIGIDEFRRSAVLLRVNEGSMLQAAAALEMWRKADFEGERIVVDALVRRRAAEKALFLTPDEGFVPAPTPVVRPRFDALDALIAPQVSPAVELTAPLEGDVATAVREDAPAANDESTPAEAAPTTTQAASASVSARMQAILEDLDLSGVAAERAEPERLVVEEPMLGPLFVEPGVIDPKAPPIVLPLPDPAAQARRHSAEDAVDAFPEPAADPIAHRPDETVAPFHRAGLDSMRIGRTPASYAPLALMLVVGVTLLAAATYWFIHAHPQMGGVTPAVIGWALGLTGVALLAASVYFLLERIGGDD